MGVDFGKAEVHNGRGLEGLEDLVAADPAGSKFLEQLDCFSRRHAGKMRQKSKNPSAKSQPRSSESEFVSANYANYANFRELMSFMFCLIRGNPRNSRIIFISFLGMPEEAL